VHNLIHPTGSWGYNEADPVRLTLRGLASCAGGQSDLDLLLSLVKWAAERERDPNLADEADLALQSSEFAERLGLSLDGDEDAVREAHSILARVHFLATSLNTFYGSSGTGDERWKWHYNAVRRRVRTYRGVDTVGDLLDLVEPVTDNQPSARQPAVSEVPADWFPDTPAAEPAPQTRWSPEDQLQLVDRLAARSGAESAAVFGAWGLGRAYDGAGRYSSKRAKIAAALEAARREGSVGQVLDAIANLIGMVPGEAADVEESRVGSEKIFISHASADRELAGLLQRALVLGGVPPNQIFYSSERLTGIPAGQNVAEYIRQSLREAGLVIELLTPTFLTRPRCLMELGGAWVSGTPTFPIVVPPLTVQAARDAIGDVHLVSMSANESNRDLFSELQDRIHEDLTLNLSARQWGAAIAEFDKNVSGAVQASRDDRAAKIADSLATKQGPQDEGDDDEFAFTGVVVRDGTLYGEATNRDSRPRSAILTVTFYNESDEIVGTEQAALDDVRPGRSRTFTVHNVPSHRRHKIEIATLI
jgi:hypothetical protein